MPDFTSKELATEARRESAMRRRVFAGFVGRKPGWTQARADIAIAKMDAIADHFDKLAAAEAEAIAPHLL